MNSLESRKEHLAKILLVELMSEEPRQWYYISIADHVFRGGYYLKAHGKIDACALHVMLNWAVQDTSVMVSGPIDEHHMESVPLSMRWRRLSEEEVRSIK